jgi:hypothetical protein
VKTIEMARDFSYRVKRNVFVQYLAGVTYPRVPEAAAREILAAGAGRTIESSTQ